MHWLRAREMMLTFGLGLVVLGGWLGYRNVQRLGQWEHASAEVVEGRSNAAEHILRVRFEDSLGEERTTTVRVRVGTVDPVPVVGDRVDIRFERGHPERATFGGSSLRDWLWVLTALGAGVLLLLFFFKTLRP